ncbi:Spy/CpxP family protein refolding chaperone [Mesorhizobium soli]|jgi:hypothetical protein|uniref:hypothetical protein n=1 Tax=Pseudaminobacter soli (ex Li et al. 2025) TaxID=1295366 RepID=UPI002475056F|nr:hypothetical protein [Mesorhizobium soli]MDH6233410.1 Spy/CpxP family protein refolding chaperone [Mesorhizobium soli]
MTLSKSLISALGLTVALAFSAPMFAATSANAAGTTATTDTNAPAPMKEKKHHKKPVHKHHKKSEAKKSAY